MTDNNQIYPASVTTEGGQLTGDIRLEADAVIVGSGAAGSVLAKKLAEGGINVILLEEGGNYSGADFSQREHEMYPMIYQRKGGQTTADFGINILQGRCLGGSTVINMADCTRIHDEVLTYWESEFGLKGLNNEALAASYARVEEALEVNKIDEGMLNANNRLLRDGCGELGYSGDCFRNNRVDCQECGYCLIGCAYDAKKSTMLNYIPAAQKAGARVFTDFRVERVVHRENRAVGVAGVIVDKKTGEKLQKFEVSANFVILSAGTFNTPQIIFNSELESTSAELGKNLSLQPQAPVLALFEQEVRAWRGVPQAWYCDHFEKADKTRGNFGYRLEGVMGGPSMGATIMPGFGLEHKKMMARFPNAAAILLLVPDPPSGSVSFYRDKPPVIDYEFSSSFIETMRAGLKSISRAWLAVGAEAVVMPFEKPTYITSEKELPVIDQHEIAPNRLKLISAHPQGTCRAGADPKKSVVDSRGFVHGAERLMVCDTSIFPTTVSSHTMIPIMAVADHFADKLLAEKERHFSAPA